MKEHPLLKWIRSTEPRLLQAEVAEKLGISEPFLSLVLSCQRGTPFDLAAKIKKLTGIPLDELAPFAEPQVERARC